MAAGGSIFYWTWRGPLRRGGNFLIVQTADRQKGGIVVEKCNRIWRLLLGGKGTKKERNCGGGVKGIQLFETRYESSRKGLFRGNNPLIGLNWKSDTPRKKTHSSKGKREETRKEMNAERNQSTICSLSVMKREGSLKGGKTDNLQTRGGDSLAESNGGEEICSTVIFKGSHSSSGGEEEGNSNSSGEEKPNKKTHHGGKSWNNCKRDHVENGGNGGDRFPKDFVREIEGTRNNGHSTWKRLGKLASIRGFV